jgi:hypothetical protein
MAHLASKGLLAIVAAVPAMGQAPCTPTQVQRLISESPMGKSFGSSLALSGDTAIIYDNLAAYPSLPDVMNRVYGLLNGIWTLQSSIPGPAGPYSIDGERAIISDPGYLPPGATVVVGRAFIFRRIGANWVQETALYQAQGYVLYGSAVALSGETAVVGSEAFGRGLRSNEWNLDASPTAGVHRSERRSRPLRPVDRHAGGVLVVGVPYYDGGSAQLGKGAAFVYESSNGTWVERARLQAPQPVAGRAFGSSVAVSNGTIVVGEAPIDGFAPPYGGAAYVFVRGAAGWRLQQQLVPAAPLGTNARFGSAVDVDGDLAMASSPSHPGPGTSGAVWMFRRVGETWTEQAMLFASGAFESGLGHRLAIAGDYAMVSARRPVSSNEYVGAVYVFGLNCPSACYPNCAGSTQLPVLNVADFTCFLQQYAAGASYANCDNSTAAPVLTSRTSPASCSGTPRAACDGRLRNHPARRLRASRAVAAAMAASSRRPRSAAPLAAWRVSQAA